ncbi:MAG: fumarylacetoacetate hydrolase family protein [Gammaproteobacteria bacterium]|nr:fumarylacetoacetate hydrolase family protein [Gammaproteobacteria bacterium]
MLEFSLNHILLDSHKIIPSKIVCIGRNYVDHIAELSNEVPDHMVVFVKPNSAISTTLHSFHQEPLHYEAELSFVYQQGKFVAVGLGLDLTKRGLQGQLKASGLPWERAKSFDGSAVFSEFVAIDTLDPTLSLELSINDQLIQQGGISLMMYKPQQILQELQSFMTLEDGDIVMTGTPKGVGVINSGSQFVGRVISEKGCLLEQHWVAQP